MKGNRLMLLLVALAAVITVISSQLPPGNCRSWSRICTSRARQTVFSFSDVSRMRSAFRTEFNRNRNLYYAGFSSRNSNVRAHAIGSQTGGTNGPNVTQPSRSKRSVDEQDTNALEHVRTKRQVSSGGCVTGCWYWHPFSLYNGGWWMVVNYNPYWYQYYNYCWCSSRSCRRSTFPNSIIGRCVQEYRWQRFLVWKRTTGLRWRWFYLRSGCCCKPN